MEKESDVPVFQFKNEGLSDRCKDVFSCLDKLEEKHQVFERSRAEEDSESDKSLIRQGPSSEESESITRDTFKHPGRDFRPHRRGLSRHDNDRAGQHGEFKIPNSRPIRGRGTSYRGRYSRGRSMPDYKSNPDRWTKYTLEDVDVSNSSMKQAAFEFLNERRQQREDEHREEGINVDSVACSKGLISFKKPVKNRDKLIDSKKGSSQHRSQTVAMEEETEDDGNGKIEQETEDMITDSNNVDMKEASVIDTDCQTSGEKRKMDLRESLEELDSVTKEDSDDKRSTGFKFRKFSRKNIRSRHEKSGSDSD